MEYARVTRETSDVIVPHEGLGERQHLVEAAHLDRDRSP